MYDYNGHFIFTKGSSHEGDVLLIEMNMLGRIISIYYSPYGAHHDIVAIDGRNLLVSGSRGDTIEDFIYEIDVGSGRITNTLDLKNVLQRTRTSGSMSYNTRDWFHHNATAYEDGGIVVSGRHQAVVKLSWPEGVIEWILGDHTGWNQMFQKYLLTPLGDGFEWQYDQHAPTIIHGFDDNPDTIDILLFDNGGATSGSDEASYSRHMNDQELRRAIENNEVVAPERYSRIVHYRINRREMTVEQIWQFGKELGEAYYSRWRGNSQLLFNGNRLGAFDRLLRDYGGDFNTSFLEVNLDGEIIWEAYASSIDNLGSFAAYRLERRPIYNNSANDLLIGVPARNLIPEDKLP